MRSGVNHVFAVVPAAGGGEGVGGEGGVSRYERVIVLDHDLEFAPSFLRSLSKA